MTRTSAPAAGTWCVVAFALVLLGGCSGSPDTDTDTDTDTDPEAALRAVCGEDAEIAEQDDPSVDEEEAGLPPTLECEVDGHLVEASDPLLLGDTLAGVISSDMDAFYSGDGRTLGWATSDEIGGTRGILVELLPLEDMEADMSLLEPLEEDGWKTGLGYPEE